MRKIIEELAVCDAQLSVLKTSKEIYQEEMVSWLHESFGLGRNSASEAIQKSLDIHRALYGDHPSEEQNRLGINILLDLASAMQNKKDPRYVM